MRSRTSSNEKASDLDFRDLDQGIPDRMPLLDRWLARLDGRRPLAGVTALLIQHQLGNHFVQARALLELGLEPERLHWLDVPYTSTPAVRAAIEGLGVPARNLRVHRYGVLEPYAPYQRARIQRILRDLLDDPPERLLVLDDGAYFLEAMSTFRSRLPRAAVVEQTTRGLIKIEESASLRRCASEIPVINVARSRPKTTLEPPFIGRAVCAALLRRIGDRSEDIAGGRSLVLGFGAIGRRVAEFLEAYLGCPRDRIHVFDPEVGRQELASRLGLACWDRDDFRTRFRLVLGCSGRSSFAIGDSVYLEDGAILASASSGSVELSRQEFIDLADGSDLDDIEIRRDGLDPTNVHSDLRFRLVDREAVFLNGGFPVNFDGRINCIPPRYIQQTVTIMVSAAVQAASATAPGLIPLDPEFCGWIDGAFRRELGEEASVLPSSP